MVTLILVTVLALSDYSHEAIPQLYSQRVDMCYHLLSQNADIKVKGMCKTVADPGWGIWGKCPPPPLQEIAYKIEIL